MSSQQPIAATLKVDIAGLVRGRTGKTVSFRGEGWEGELEKASDHELCIHLERRPTLKAHDQLIGVELAKTYQTSVRTGHPSPPYGCNFGELFDPSYDPGVVTLTAGPREREVAHQHLFSVQAVSDLWYVWGADPDVHTYFPQTKGFDPDTVSVQRIDTPLIDSVIASHINELVELVNESRSLNGGVPLNIEPLETSSHRPNDISRFYELSDGEGVVVVTHGSFYTMRRFADTRGLSYQRISAERFGHRAMKRFLRTQAA